MEQEYVLDNGHNRLRTAYQSSKELLSKGSDKLFMSAITIDTMLGNPSVAYAQASNDASADSSNNMLYVWVSLSCLYTTLSATAEDKNAKRGLGLIAVCFGLAGVLEAMRL